MKIFFWKEREFQHKVNCVFRLETGSGHRLSPGRLTGVISLDEVLRVIGKEMMNKYSGEQEKIQNAIQAHLNANQNYYDAGIL